MFKHRRLLAAVAVGAALVAGVVYRTGTATAESNGGLRIMPLGDSITDGVAVPGGYRIDLWSKLVAGGYKIDFVGSQYNGPSTLGDHDHEGHPGWTIAQIDANVVNWLRTYTPRTILLHIGTNDIYGSDPAGAPSRLGTLLDHITSTSPDAEVFVAQIIPMSVCCASTVRTFNAALPALVQTRANAGKHVHLVDMYDALTTADLAADGVHPTAAGYGKMATVWYTALRSVPSSLTPVGTSPSPTVSSTTASSSATPTASTTSSPASTTSPSTGSACTATYQTVSSWGSGFQAQVTVRNSGSAALNGWTVRMTLASGQTITNLWNGTVTGSSGAISVQNASYNGSLSAGGSTTFGYVANGNGALAPSAVSCSSP